MQILRSFIALYTVTVLIGGLLSAQSTHGVIVGTVSDATKAVIPGVSLAVTNTNTGISRTVLSGENGAYEATNLLPGTYRVSAELPGFKTFVRDGIVVESRATVRIDVAMEVGEQTTKVEVTAATPLLHTEDAQIVSQRTARQLDELPAVATGEALAYIMTAPGVQSSSIFTFSFNGSRAAQSEYAIDGITSPRTFATPLTGTQNTLEMTSELKIHSANNSAEFASPGVISVVTKSGTNDLHGNLFYYHSNSALNARNFFVPQKPKTKTHTFGAAFGGPVFVPAVYDGHNRTFFMVSFWGTRIPGSNEVNATVPSLPMRRGDFSQFSAAIIDPQTGTAFAGNLVPEARLNAVSLRVQQRFFPLPNFGNTNVLTSGNFRDLMDRENLTNRFEGRIDQKLSDKNMLYTRYAWRGGPQQPVENLPTIGLRNGYRRGSSFILSDTHVISDRLINEFRYGFQRSPNQVLGPLNGQDVLNFIGVQGVAGGAGLRGMPQFLVTGLTPVSSVNHTVDVQAVYQLTETVTWTRSGHSFKFGTDVERTHANGVDLPLPFFGSFNFSGFFTGQAYADFLLGLPERSSRSTYRGATYLRGTQWNLFAQDDWKLSPRITLNLGARYEYEFAPVDKDGLMYNLDPAAMRLVVPDRTLSSGRINPLLPSSIKVVGAKEAGFPQTLRQPDKNNIFPRVGIAVRPNNVTVVRAGYGVFVDSLGVSLTPPQRDINAPLFGFSEEFRNSDKRRPVFTLPSPFGAAGSIGTISAAGINRNFRNPYVQQWNLSIERELPRQIGIRASYIGTKSTQLGFRRELNVPLPSATPFSNARRPFPQFGSVLFADNGGNSIYHALQLDAERRFGAGFYFQAAWTYANLLSDVEDARNDAGPVIENPFNRRAERGRESYSVRHRVNGALIYELPVGRGRRYLSSMPSLLNQFAGGWAVSSLMYFETGRFFTPGFSGVDISGTGATGGRPDRIADGNLPAGQRNVNRWFDRAAFMVPAANRGRFGNAGRNILEGPGLNVQHFSLLKRLYLNESVNVQFQMNILNVFNHPNFDVPPSNISVPATVGKITLMRSRLEAADGSRTMSAELRVNF